MKSYWLSVVPKSNENELKRDRKDTRRHKEEGHVMMEVETEVMLPQTKRCLQTPEAASQGDFLSTASGGTTSLLKT